MDTASTSEIISKLKEFELLNGIGSVRSIATVVSRDRTIKYIFNVIDKDNNESKIEISSVKENSLWESAEK